MGQQGNRIKQEHGLLPTLPSTPRHRTRLRVDLRDNRRVNTGDTEECRGCGKGFGETQHVRKFPRIHSENSLRIETQRLPVEPQKPQLILSEILSCHQFLFVCVGLVVRATEIEPLFGFVGSAYCVEIRAGEFLCAIVVPSFSLPASFSIMIRNHPSRT